MQEPFEATKMRLAVNPPLDVCHMARLMKLSDTYLYDLERGARPWSYTRREEFKRILRDWEANPKPHERKKRSDAGKPKGRRKVRRRPCEMDAIPLAHSHREIVGIG